MLLTPYRNPPYRMPTPKGSLSPLLREVRESPKRKREEPTSFNIESADGDTRFRPGSGAESPRGNVVAKLRDLQIDGPSTPGPDFNVQVVQPRKKLKRQPSVKAAPLDYELEIEETPLRQQPGDHAIDITGKPPQMEIDETPDCKTRQVSPPCQSAISEPSLSSSVAQLLSDDNQDVALTSPPSPPPPTPLGSPDPNTAAALSLALEDSPLIDQAALTWQEDEITGQDIDATSPDDDGEGINGIGFKPTAAIAYARSQKRKQQVNEWKAREAREARQRRFERRRGGSNDVTAEQAARRAVRFAGIG